jgi:uncharacterized protein (DUF4415 family)
VTAMKNSYDFSKGKRGRIMKAVADPAGEVKITIRLDKDVIDYFLAKADESGGVIGYQTLINEALRRSIDAPSLEVMVRRAILEELKGKPDAA